MKLKTLALFVTLAASCLAINEAMSQSASKFICMDTLMQSNIMMHEFPENYSLETEEITFEEYNKLQKKNKKEKNSNLTSVLLTDSAITIYLAKGEKEFRSTQTEIYEYVRQLSSINQHIILHLSASSATASLLLVDGITGFVTYTFSPFDTCADNLIISPDGKQLCAIINDVYEDNNSAIMTIDIMRHDKGYVLQPQILHTFDTFNITEFCWIGDQSIAIKTLVKINADSELEDQQNSVSYQHIVWKK